MNEQTFRQLLAALDETDWLAVAGGQCLLMVDDQRLAVGPANEPNAILRGPQQAPVDAAVLQREALADAAALLANYYLTHPLTPAGFNHQVQQLIVQHGAAAFAAPAGQLPQRTLFVDGGEVVAEPPDSPRHPYGAFCELERPMAGAALDNRVQAWLESGEAHQRYLSMNVCRYNC